MNQINFRLLNLKSNFKNIYFDFFCQIPLFKVRRFRALSGDLDRIRQPRLVIYDDPPIYEEVSAL